MLIKDTLCHVHTDMYDHLTEFVEYRSYITKTIKDLL